MFVFLASVALADPLLPAATPVFDQLKVRDAVACTDLGTPNLELKQSLLTLTDPALLPASVPVRAAGCLVSLFPADADVEAAVIGWISDTERQGLALVALARTDTLPADLALRLVTAARASAVPRVAAAAEGLRNTSIHTAIRAL